MEKEMHLNSILQPGAEPYLHSEHVIRATATVDTTAILLDELAKLGEPLPIPIATHGFSRIADDVARLLDERGQQRYTESQWRSALREVFRQLTDSKGDTAHRSPNLARKDDDMSTLTGKYEPDPEEVRIAARRFENGVDALDMASVKIHARAEQILATRDYTPDQYLEAVMQAQRELEPTQSENRRGYTAAESAALHAETVTILLARDSYRTRGEWDADEYSDALVEAEKILSIDLTGRGA
jgi:hypothetical protein